MLVQFRMNRNTDGMSSQMEPANPDVRSHSGTSFMHGPLTPGNWIQPLPPAPETLSLSTWQRLSIEGAANVPNIKISVQARYLRP